MRYRLSVRGRMTPYGERMCMQLVEGLARLVPGLCIVSGLAFGIDSAAHRAALAHGVATVAVVANALPEVTLLNSAARAGYRGSMAAR